MRIPSATSSALLFTKQGCPPCGRVKAHLPSIEGKLLEHLHIKDKDDYPHLREVYGIDLFPTLLLLNSEGEEIDRVVGGNNVIHHLQSILFQIHEARV